MSDTGKSVLTKEQVEELIAKAAADFARAVPKGAQVEIGVQDQRFTKLISWVWVTLGAIAVLAGTWGVNSLNDLTLKVGVLINQRERDAEENRELRSEVRTLRSEVYELKAKVK